MAAQKICLLGNGSAESPIAVTEHPDEQATSLKAKAAGLTLEAWLQKLAEQNHPIVAAIIK
jgi:hypothetical protein